MNKVTNSDAIFNLLFGWAFVAITLLLFLIFIVALRSILEYKNADIVKGKIIKLADIGELSLPTVEYQIAGKMMQFRTKTPILNLAVGQFVEVQVAKSKEARIYDKSRPEKIPTIMFMATALLAFFVVKSCSFLLTLFG
ncbi:MAG: hypothetical protein L3J51_10310 [Cocleimonas sp.]|nr:hypothetical protein [Cocleimonas sp.]